MGINLKSKLKSVLSVIVSGAMLFSVASSLPSIETAAADSCVIDTSVTYQTIKGFGGMNHPEWTGSDLTDAQRQTAFGNGDDELGMSIVRVYVNDDKTQWYKALATAQDVVSRGGIVFATPWNPPADMCETFTRTYTTWDGKTVTQENQKRLRHDKYAEYAQHLNDFVHYMRDNGVELYAISIQNEPDYGEDWTWMTSDECVDFLANYADQIDCPVMSPESFSYNKEYYTKILNNSEAYANTAIFGTHFYGTSRANMDFPELESCGKEIFMTEVYTPNSDADSSDRWPESIQVAENIHNGLVVGNMNAYVWWYIRRSYGPMKEDGTISKRGYCMAQYSKFVRPGDVRIEATEQPADNVYISAYKNNDNQVTIVAINMSDSGYAQNFSISGDVSIENVDRYRTSSSESLAYTASLDADGNSFWAQLPAQSVSTFIVDVNGDIGGTDSDNDNNNNNTVNTEPDENGYYFHNTFEDSSESWEGHGDAEVTLSGRTPYMGTNALLVQNRASAWNGVQKSLNTAVFVPGTEYSFSVCVKYLEGSVKQNFALTLQYTDSNGDTKYSRIALATAVRGYYAQLANTNYKIPEGASNIVIYVETDSGTGNFYIDEAIGAVAGTKIDGPDPVSYILGDINCDGTIDAFDIAAARSGLTEGFESSISELAADTDQSGEYEAADAVLIQSLVLGRITSFPSA